MGVILFALVVGSMPFLGHDDFALTRAIIYKDPFESVSTEHVDAKLEALMRNLLNKDPRTRWNIYDLHKDPWLTGDGKIPLERTTIEGQSQLRDTITEFETKTAIVPRYKCVSCTKVSAHFACPARSSCTRVSPSLSVSLYLLHRSIDRPIYLYLIPTTPPPPTIPTSPLASHKSQS